MRIVVTGAGGLLAHALLPVLERNHQVIGLTRRDCDLCDEHSVRRVFQYQRPDIVVHVAGFTNVDACEIEPEKAKAGNEVATLNVAKAAQAMGAAVLYTSTDYVFDGQSDRPYLEDDRGCFAEIFRFGSSGLARDFLPEGRRQIQISYTVSYPGVIKAIHYHFEQTDLWAPLKGMFQVFLCDLREDSRAWGCVNTLFIGVQRPWKIRIPPGVAHGYKVIGTEPAQLLYATNHFYDPADEGRMAFDDPDINYEWGQRPR